MFEIQLSLCMGMIEHYLAISRWNCKYLTLIVPYLAMAVGFTHHHLNAINHARFLGVSEPLTEKYNS